MGNKTQRARKSRERILPFEIAYLPYFKYISLEYWGNNQHISDIDEVWKQLKEYALKIELLFEKLFEKVQIKKALTAICL